MVDVNARAACENSFKQCTRSANAVQCHMQSASHKTKNLKKRKKKPAFWLRLNMKHKSECECSSLLEKILILVFTSFSLYSLMLCLSIRIYANDPND